MAEDIRRIGRAVSLQDQCRLASFEADGLPPPGRFEFAGPTVVDLLRAADEQKERARWAFEAEIWDFNASIAWYAFGDPDQILNDMFDTSWYDPHRDRKSRAIEEVVRDVQRSELQALDEAGVPLPADNFFGNHARALLMSARYKKSQILRMRPTCGLGSNCEITKPADQGLQSLILSYINQGGCTQNGAEDLAKKAGFAREQARAEFDLQIGPNKPRRGRPKIAKQS